MCTRRVSQTSRHDLLALLVGTVLLCSIGTFEDAQAQRQRQGFWLEAGFGGGWNLIRGLDAGSTPNAGGYLRLGGTPSGRLLAGVEVLGWARAVRVPPALGNYVFSAFNLSGVVLLYPLRSWPVYVKGGLGATTVDISVDAKVGFQVRSRQNGIGATFGAGIETPAVGAFLITFSADWAGQSFGWQPQKLRRIDQNAFLVLAAGIRWQ